MPSTQLDKFFKAFKKAKADLFNTYFSWVFTRRSLTFVEKLEICFVCFFFVVDVGVLQIPVQELIQFQISISFSLQVQFQVNEVTCTLQERVCVQTASGCCSELFVLLSLNRSRLLITIKQMSY